MAKMAHELSRKEMRGPDRFQLVAANAAAWMGKQRKQIAIVAAGILVAAVLAAVVAHIVESGREDAGGAMSKAIDAASGQISGVPAPDSEQPVYKSVEDKERAVLDLTSKVKKGSLGGRAGVTAALLEGDAHLALREWDRATSAYQQFLAGSPKNDSLRFAALDGLARAEEGKGDLAGAVKAYETASGIESFKDWALLGKARVLAKAGKGAEARKVLEGVSSLSPLRGEAQERLSRLVGSR